MIVPSGKGSLPSRKAFIAEGRRSVSWPHRLEAGTQLLAKELGLFPGREVPALVDLVVMNELGKRLLGPALRARVELVGEDADGRRDGDALHVQERELVLRVEAEPRDGRVRQPAERDVVEHVVAREALALAVEVTRDQLVARLVVI